MNSKSLFDKRKCLKCKYHGESVIIGYEMKVKQNDKFKIVRVFCNYLSVNTEHKTCLMNIGGEVIDRRGEDYNNCLLFEAEEI